MPPPCEEPDVWRELRYKRQHCMWLSTKAASSSTGRNVSHGISKGIGKVTINPMLQVHRGGRNMVNEIVVVVILYTYERPYANEINNELKISLKIVAVINSTGGKSRHFTGENILLPGCCRVFLRCYFFLQCFWSQGAILTTRAMLGTPALLIANRKWRPGSMENVSRGMLTVAVKPLVDTVVNGVLRWSLFTEWVVAPIRTTTYREAWLARTWNVVPIFMKFGAWRIAGRAAGVLSDFSR